MAKSTCLPEYASVGLTDDGSTLERATLMRTGFLPPIFKGRIQVRFDDRLDSGVRTDEIVAMAMADVAESD